MFTYLKAFPWWFTLVIFAAVFGIVMGFGGLSAWGTAGDPEKAVNLYSTGLAFSGAILGAIGATAPSFVARSEKRRAKVKYRDAQNARDCLSAIGWACVVLGAGISFAFQVDQAWQTFMKLIPFMG